MRVFTLQTLIGKVVVCAGSNGFRRTAVSVAVLMIASTGCSNPGPAQSTPTHTPVAAAPAVETAPPASTDQTGVPASAALPAATTQSVTLAKLDLIKGLLEENKGKVIVVNVWATFCIPCIEEMPELAKFYTERDAATVAFVSLNADPAYSLDDAVKPFIAEYKLPFPVYLLDEVSPLDLGDALDAAGTNWEGALPATFVVGKDGKLKKYWLEQVHGAELAAAVADAVNG